MRTKWDDNRSPEVIALITELREVCRRHGLSLGHEDGHGAFTVQPWHEALDKWLGDAGEEAS